jgi:PAS domain S-box-containing protein
MTSAGAGTRRSERAARPLCPKRHIRLEWLLLMGESTDSDAGREGARAPERQLRDALQQLQIVTEAMSAPVTRCSRDLRYLWVSKPYADRLGLRPEDIVGRRIVDVIGEAAFDTIRPHVEQVLTGKRVEYEERVPYLGLGLRWIHATYTPTFDEQGSPDGWVAVVLDVDERRQAEDTLRRSEPRLLHFAAIVESSDAAIIGKDTEGIVASWNRAAERLFGYTADDMIGRSIRAIIPADRQAEEDEVLKRIRRGETVDHFETVRQRKDGMRIPVSLTISPIRTPAGAIVGVSTIARDVTERTRAEQAMADLQERLLALVAASRSLLASPRTGDVLPAAIRIARELIPADGYAVWQLDQASQTWRIGAYEGISAAFAARMVAANQAAGVSTESFAEPIVAEDVHALPELESRRDAYRSEGVVSILIVPLTLVGALTGVLVWYYRTHQRFSDVEVQTARAIANLLGAAMRTAELYDEQRRSREQADFLAKAGAILASSLDTSDTLKTLAGLAVPRIADWCTVDVVDEQGALERVAVAHVDPAKVQLAKTLQEKYPEDPQSPYGAYEVLRTCRPVFVSETTDDVLVRGAVDEEHLRILRELGLVSYMRLPLAAHERVRGVLTFVCAESGRRYTEADVRFGESVAARAALAMASAEAYEEARRANRLKDDFLATLSHELRTPLNAIVGYARMLRTGALPQERTASAMEALDRNATLLTQIVEDVLDVSRITSGKIRLDVQRVDLPRVVDEAVATVQPAAQAKRVRIQVIVDPRAAPVSGDPDRLQQAVWNLLSNAVKFTPSGGRVQVRVERISSHVEVAVSDTGRGIAPEFLPYVFERFRQADSGFSREYGGLGLGLAIARSIVELHGGTIHAASEGEGKGATFRIRLPVMIVHAEPFTEQARVHPQAERPVAEHALAHLDGVRVLAVDDDEDSLTLLRAILEATGAQVMTAVSGRDALDVLEHENPDVLLADIGMPQMDGFELIRQVRQSTERWIRQLPAAALTAYARSEDRTRTLRSGFQMHLAKPIDPRELVAAIAALVRRQDTG